MSIFTTKTMKILYYTHTYFLDCDLPLIREFRRAGHDIYFIMELVPYSLHSTIIDISRQNPTVGILKIDTYPELSFLNRYLDIEKSFLLNRPCKIYSRRNMKLRVDFQKLVKRIQPDIIHCTDFIDLVDLFLYKYRKRIVQIVHDPFPHSGEKTKRKFINRFIAFRLLSTYVLLNSKQKATFIDTFSLGKKNVFVNELGVYECIHLYKTGESNIGSKKHKVLFWGRISPYKGVEYLLQAMVKVLHDYPNVELVIAGNGCYYFDLTPYNNIENIKIVNRFLSMSEIYQYLLSSDFVVCPYTDATQSGVIMTAFALLKPVIATNVGGLSEMVEDKVTGLIVPPRNVMALEQAIRILLENSSYRDELSDNIKKKYYKGGEHSWENIMNRYIVVYKTILS